MPTYITMFNKQIQDVGSDTNIKLKTQKKGVLNFVDLFVLDCQ